MVKTDRRVKKTRQQLRTHLAQLMCEKSIQEITVKELVEKADINRSTFYLHYSDIHQLLDTLEQELLAEIIQVIDERNFSSLDENSLLFLQDILRVLSNNLDICQALVGPNGDLAFVHKIEQLVANGYQNIISNHISSSTNKVEYFHSYCLTGCVGLIKSWILNGAKESPEEMAKFSFSLISNSIQKFVEEHS